MDDPTGLEILAYSPQLFYCVATSLVMHTLAFVLSAAQISEMLAFQSDYTRLITSNTGACDGYDMLASFFSTRITYAIAMTVVNIVSLVGSTYLTWRLSAVSLFSLVFTFILTLGQPYGVEALRNAEVRAAWLVAQALFSATQVSTQLRLSSGLGLTLFSLPPSSSSQVLEFGLTRSPSTSWVPDLHSYR
jgi:hypothetical protein